MAEHENDRDEQERNAEIRRETAVRDALGPIEGTDAERNAAEEALDRDVTREQPEADREPATRAHVERGARSDESMTITGEGVRQDERP